MTGPPNTVALGRVVIAKDGPGFLYLMPDGETGWGMRGTVERRIKAWAKKNTKPDEISGLIVEWPA